MNIHARFLFETRFYAEREKGLVPTARLNELMVEAQKEAYRDALRSTTRTSGRRSCTSTSPRSPSTTSPTPSASCSAPACTPAAQEEGPAFARRYVDLLRDTGRMRVEDLAAKHLGVDLTKPDFWQAAVDVSVAGRQAVPGPHRTALTGRRRTGFGTFGLSRLGPSPPAEAPGAVVANGHGTQSENGSGRCAGTRALRQRRVAPPGHAPPGMLLVGLFAKGGAEPVLQAIVIGGGATAPASCGIWPCAASGPRSWSRATWCTARPAGTMASCTAAAVTPSRTRNRPGSAPWKTRLSAG